MKQICDNTDENKMFSTRIKHISKSGWYIYLTVESVLQGACNWDRVESMLHGACKWNRVKYVYFKVYAGGVDLNLPCKVHVSRIELNLLQGTCKWDRVYFVCFKVHANGIDLIVCCKVHADG